MVDFKKLVKKKRDIDFRNLIALFESLDRQTSHIEMRPVQLEALQLLSDRRNERDIVLKISTGTGKTAVGLLYLLCFMEELRKPVVYLCPTRQLVDQVQAEAQKLGINTVTYLAGQPFPHVDGISGKAIIICTYDKLFNAKTTFDRSDVLLRPCAFALDDAHAGVEEIRDSFTVHISENDLHKRLLKILDKPCRKFKPSVWRDVINLDPNQSMEIPYWIFKPLLPEIDTILGEYADDKDMQFVIPYVRDILRWCRYVVSGAGIEIIPEVLPVVKSDAYFKANHRLFMSATLADDSVLVRELDCDLSSAQNAVIPSSDKGLGERMVLAPSLVDSSLNREWLMSICKSFAKKIRVVVLSPSEMKAREWEKFGAKVFLGDDVRTAVQKIKNTTANLNFVVFVQRYDGIDLPDNSCRVLVLDGIPLGEGIIDRHDSSLSSLAGGTRNRIIYRIEQGMGRAVRSHADYAVVLLAGSELAHFIAKHEVLSRMNPDTQAQLRLAMDLSKLAIDDSDSKPDHAIIDMMIKCLNRDIGWKQFYNETVRSNDKPKLMTTDHKRLYMAYAERRAFDAALVNDHSVSVKILREAVNEYVSEDHISKGWYLQRIANYLYDINPGEALEVQRAAYKFNRFMICPPAIIKRPEKIEPLDTYTNIMKWYKQFENPNGAIANIQELRCHLSFDLSPTVIEQAVCDLAPLLGAQGSRPEKEYGEGPDDLWLWPDLAVVIEAKTQNEDSLHKRDAGQLLLSMEWFKKNYPTRKNFVPLIIAKIATSDRRAGFPSNTRVMIENDVHSLLDSLEQFYRRIISKPLFASTPESLARIQRELNLTSDEFINSFTVGLREVRA